jgi:Fur family ferric uptake transcriptional regulator
VIADDTTYHVDWRDRISPLATAQAAVGYPEADEPQPDAAGLTQMPARTDATANPLAPRLSAGGERVTRQRLLVAEALAAAGRQLSAQELYDRIRVEHPDVGRATVFRALEALVSVGAARRLERPGHIYAYVSCEPEHHHHLVCTQCGRVEEIGERHVGELSEAISARYRFHIEDATLDFYGRCARCQGARS